MRKILVFTLASIFVLASCHDHAEEPEVKVVPDETIMMYFPWSQGNDHIYQSFLNNISAMKMAVELNKGIGNRKLMVYIAQSATNGVLIDIAYKDGVCVEDTLKRYTNLNGRDYSLSSGIASFFNDVKQASQGSKSYSIIMGCHGMGWLPVGKGPSSAKKALMDEEVFPSAEGSVETRGSSEIETNVNNEVETRYFGHASLEDYQANVSELSIAIKSTFGRVKMLTIDDCYMSNIEIAYDLRNLADYYIASTSEVTVDGLPYRTLGIDLINGDYQSVCNKYDAYYHSPDNTFPYGTLAVIKLDQVDAVVSLMKRINEKYGYNGLNPDEIQWADNYRYTIFFDMSDYVRALCKNSDEALYNEFLAAMDKLIPYKAWSDEYYSNKVHKKINTFCGVTISDPTRSPSLYHEKQETNWWKATH